MRYSEFQPYLSSTTLTQQLFLQPFATLPVPQWNYGKSVSMDNLKNVTDSYVKSMEPKRKLKIAQVPAQVKDSLAAFAKTLKQDGSASEITNLVMKALAEKAVVEENGKAVDLKVSMMDMPTNHACIMPNNL